MNINNEDFEGSGIYCYENKINGKKYIGQSINLKKRISDHERNFKKDVFENTNAGENKPLWYAIKKYGRENFEIYILEQVEPKCLDDKEEYYISFFNSLVNENGYNILKRGFSRFGILHSQETKLKLSIIHSNISEETRNKMRNSQKGRKHSEETKLKIGNAHRGKVLSQETIDKVRRTGKDHFMFGKHHSDETKRKMSENSGKGYGTKQIGSSSKYHGVNYYKDGKKWKAWVNIDKKRIHLGYYNSEENAGKAYDIGAELYYKDKAKLNFPELRENYISYLNQYEISDIKELRQIIKDYIS